MRLPARRLELLRAPLRPARVCKAMAPVHVARVAKESNQAEAVQKMTAEIVKALKQPDIVAKLNELALDPGGMPRDKFAAMVNADHARWGAVIKAAGMKLE